MSENKTESQEHDKKCLLVKRNIFHRSKGGGEEVEIQAKTTAEKVKKNLTNKSTEFGKFLSEHYGRKMGFIRCTVFTECILDCY